MNVGSGSKILYNQPGFQQLESKIQVLSSSAPKDRLMIYNMLHSAIAENYANNIKFSDTRTPNYDMDKDKKMIGQNYQGHFPTNTNPNNIERKFYEEQRIISNEPSINHTKLYKSSFGGESFGQPSNLIQNAANINPKSN